VSEQILNATSAQLLVGYTVPFTSVHAGKIKNRHTAKN